LVNLLSNVRLWAYTRCRSRSFAAVTNYDSLPLVCGGADKAAAQLNSCERYSNGQWTKFAPMPKELTMLGMVTLNNKPHVFGGIMPTGNRSQSVFVYGWLETNMFIVCTKTILFLLYTTPEQTIFLKTSYI
jgi:hypothetical protein